MTNASSISYTVMRRVRAIRALRVFGAPATAALLLAGSLWGIGRLVWVAKVFENLAGVGGIIALPGFFAGAFLGTGMAEQVLVVLSVIATAWLATALGRAVAAGDASPRLAR